MKNKEGSQIICYSKLFFCAIIFTKEEKVSIQNMPYIISFRSKKYESQLMCFILNRYKIREMNVSFRSSLYLYKLEEWFEL